MCPIKEANRNGLIYLMWGRIHGAPSFIYLGKSPPPLPSSWLCNNIMTKTYFICSYSWSYNLLSQGWCTPNKGNFQWVIPTYVGPPLQMNKTRHEYFLIYKDEHMNISSSNVTMIQHTYCTLSLVKCII